MCARVRVAEVCEAAAPFSPAPEPYCTSQNEGHVSQTGSSRLVAMVSTLEGAGREEGEGHMTQ